MVRIPGGKFFMGSDDKDDLEFERPAHKVTLAAVLHRQYEVTVGATRRAATRASASAPGPTNEWDGRSPTSERKAFDPLCNVARAEAQGEHPINCVDWEMADAFCKAPTEAASRPRPSGSSPRAAPTAASSPGATSRPTRST